MRITTGCRLLLLLLLLGGQLSGMGASSTPCEGLLWTGLCLLAACWLGVITVQKVFRGLGCWRLHQCA
jgi:hypothetical protein